MLILQQKENNGGPESQLTACLVVTTNEKAIYAQFKDHQSGMSSSGKVLPPFYFNFAGTVQRVF